MNEVGPVLASGRDGDIFEFARGAPLTDVAMTYVLLTCPRVPGPSLLRAVAQLPRLVLARAFMHRYRTLARAGPGSSPRAGRPPGGADHHVP